MITIVTATKTESLPYCIAYEQGVFSFKFLGDKTFTGATYTWTWEGVVDDAPLIQSVRAGTVILLSVNTLQDCLDNDQTFFYNGSDGRLYIHWLGSQGDYSVGRGQSSIQQSSLFYANGVDRVAKGYYDNTLYEPKVQEVGGFSLQADPIKFGLVARADSSFSLINANGFFDNVSDTLARGQVVEVYVVENEDTSLDNADLVFKGFTKNLFYSQEVIDIEIEEQRFFLNGPVCPNVYASDPGVLDDKYVGKPKPVAFGDIRRGICVPLDSDGVEKGDAVTITFQVADPAIGAVRSIDALYDSNGNSVTLGTINLTNCTVQYSKPSGVDIDLDGFSWEGEGYDIGDLTYNNGLDIIQFAFNEFGNTPFVTSTFDTVEWSQQSAINNQPVGLSIQSTRGFTESIIEPITVSLQGVVITRGDGLITFLNRDTEAAASARFTFDELLSRPTISYNTDSFVSSVAVGFSKDFVKDRSVIEENTTFEDSIIQAYGLKTRGDISPVESVLRDRADAISLGNEIMDTSKSPDRLLSFTVKLSSDTIGLTPFKLVDVDSGRYNSPDRKKVEILSISPDYNRYEVTISGRILEDIEDDLAAPSLYGPGLYGESVYGG